MVKWDYIRENNGRKNVFVNFVKIDIGSTEEVIRSGTLPFSASPATFASRISLGWPALWTEHPTVQPIAMFVAVLELWLLLVEVELTKIFAWAECEKHSLALWYASTCRCYLNCWSYACSSSFASSSVRLVLVCSPLCPCPGPNLFPSLGQIFGFSSFLSLYRSSKGF